MGKMAGIHADRMIRALQRLGWRIQRVKGSHHSLVRPDRAGIVTVAVPKGRTLKEKTARSVLKQAGIAEAEFFEVYR
jgi:predicted RNA binding protein YcfA (HicA-like mRNA interferase family)